MKFVNLLALALFFISSCAQKHSYKSIYSAGETYCAITSKGTKCFRYTQDPNNKLNDQSFSPLFLDEIGLPRTYEKKVFSYLKMDFSSGDRVTRVCGYNDLKEPSCWEYEGYRSLVKPTDLTSEDKTAYRLGGVGVVQNYLDPSQPSFRTNWPTKQNFFVSCSFAANSRKLTCNSGELSAKWQAPADIKKVAVNDQVCIYTSDDNIYCLKMALEHRLKFNEPAAQIGNIPELTQLRLLSLDNQFFVCAISQAGTDCKKALNAPLGVLPINLAEAPTTKLLTPLGLLMIDQDHKLLKIAINLDQMLTKPAQPELLRKYQSVSYGDKTACLVEKDSGELFCYRLSLNGFDAQLGASLPTPY